MVRYYRKIIKIKAEDSPNVRLGLLEKERGLKPTNRMVVAGVLPYDEYCKRRALWDKVRQCIGLDAEFYEGAEVLLFPPTWLNHAERAEINKLCQESPTEAIGIDPAEGGDKTAMAAVNRYGLKELVSKRTPDTSIITGEALAFCIKHKVKPEKCCFDRGGGGKQHVDRLRAMGYAFRTVAFGESLVRDPQRRGFVPQLVQRLDEREDHYAFVNRRAEMYGELREQLDPSIYGNFALPKEYTELRRQLSLMPLLYDPEGRMRMLPKNKRGETSQDKTLVELLGCSPDESDALVLALHAMYHGPKRVKAGSSI